MDAKTLPQALRALHAAKVHHFTPVGHGGQPQAPAFAIVATEERLGVLLEAASELEARQRVEDRKSFEQLQGWIDQQEAAANGRPEALASELATSLEQDGAIRARLIAAGWTPPGEKPKLSNSLQAMLDDPDSELVTHGQVREAAQAELATWDQAAPGGPTSYEVAHSICRRLGVAL